METKTILKLALGKKKVIRKKGTRKMQKSVRYMVFIVWVFGITETRGQTCCSGGTPLTGNLGIQGIESKSWYFQLSYDFNFLNDLYSGSNKLDDNSRERVTQTVLFQAIYAFSDKFSVNGLFSYVDQKRTIFSPIGETNITQTGGMGDIVLLAQYTPLSNLKRSLTLAAGPKLPTGKFDAVDPEFGLVLSPDMQPGTGSFDAIFGTSFREFHLFNIPGLTFIGTAGYRMTTPAERFEGDFKYKFGNETMLSTGIQKTFLIRRTAINPSIFLSYRNTGRDRVDGSDIEATGGNWLNLNPGINIEPGNKWAINLSGEIPLFRKLNGTQLSTSYRINIGVTFKIFN